ncbi:hypothetical protein Tsubulata_047897 [Turnera subulata]|uniref:NB-ARC domain-containing protein n=1 Tax=Turnera subulata TaxID=218843 RepID=A0A9Q0JBZ5_9ROSI|nr:hypothetical protein Tsubulata_047897 [Turnera subulata]
MDLRKEEENQILEHLRGDSVSKIFLVEEAGAGKTWMARKVKELAVKNGLFYAVLWISMNVKLDAVSLHKNIASQLSRPFSVKSLEEADFDDEEVENLGNLKKAVSKELDQRKRRMKVQANRKILLILDDEGSQMDEEIILPQLEAILGESHSKSWKLLISRRNIANGQNIEDTSRVINIEPLSRGDSLSLLNEIVSRTSRFGSEQLFETVIGRSLGLPSAIVLIGEAINHFEHSNDSWESALERALEETVGYETAEKDASVLLNCVYDMLPSHRTTLINCFWHCRHFFPKCGGVHYNELITHWIMEGCFDPISQVEKAYEEGHNVLLELLGRCIIQIQEDNVVTMDGAMQGITNSHHQGFEGATSLALFGLDGGWNGFGKITPAGGMIKTLCSERKWGKVSALLIDGSHLARGVSEPIMKEMKQLEVLAIFDPSLSYLPPSLSEMMKPLVVLVLRGCNLLVKIDQISELKKLTVLEISGARWLKEIPDNFFEKLTELQTLNLSGSGLGNLPSSLSSLRKLRFLILRSCLCLETLPSIKDFTNLEVLDVSNATLFRILSNPDRNLSKLRKLRSVDLSRTLIPNLPILRDPPKLSRLLLGGCGKLRLSFLEKLPSLQILDLSGSAFKVLPSTVNLKGLKVLDVSGACKLDTIQDKSFNHLSLLRSLNMSQTKIKRLPSLSDLHNLRCHLLKGCKELAELPDVVGLKRLKELDLSGCTSLKKLPQLKSLQMLKVLDLADCSSLETFQDQSFENMPRLQKLTLSGTVIEDLSSLENSVNLSYLVLKNCLNLKCLPPPERLLELEVLDLEGVSNPNGINSKLLEQLHSRIQSIHLFKIKFSSFAFVSKLINLRQLSLKGCSGLAVPCLQDLTNLEVLDLSGTDVTSLSSVENLSSLQELLLCNCLELLSLPSLKLLVCLEKLDISGSAIKEFPYDISELWHLKHLSMDNMKHIREIDWRRIRRLPEELNWGQLDISNIDEKPADGKKPTIRVNGTQFFQLLSPSLRKRCLDQNFFNVSSPIEQAGGDKNYHRRDESILNDAYFAIRQFPRNSGRSLRLFGSNTSPVVDMKDVLEQAEYISLVENKFMKSISDLGSGNLKLKGCWLERCPTLKNIFCEDDKDAKLGETLEILWISNLLNLKSLCSEKVVSINFSKLERLHLDCCPELECVFPSSLSLKNLKVFEVRFCDKLTKIFGDGPVQGELPKLQRLLLLELPELTTIGVRLPSTAQIRLAGCPKLKLTGT